MTRKQKLFLNGGISLLKQAVTMICAFILPRYMLVYYGSDVNGLVASITHFLSFISLLEMGIGPVIQANLYGPLAQNDSEQISRIVISSERFFRKLALIFLAYVAVLAVVFPVLIKADFDRWFSVSLLIIIAISTFAEYFFGSTYQLLLNADQKSYVQITIVLITTVLNTLFCVLLMETGASIHMVRLLTAVIFIMRPVSYTLYVRKHYRLNKRMKLTEEPIRQKWSGFAQHIASVVCNNVDVVVLTLFSTLANISIYSIYFNVAHGVANSILVVAAGLSPFFGNMIAQKEQKTLNQSFAIVEWGTHTVVTIIFTIAAITIAPFVLVYTKGVTDANYYNPIFGFVLVTAYGAQCMRIPYFRLVSAAGHFKETQIGAFISAALNVAISVALVFRFGLIGIATGTLIAMFYHTVYLVRYLRGNILNRPIGHFLKYLFSDILTLTISVIISRFITLNAVSCIAWIIFACKISGVTILVSILINCIINRDSVLKTLKNIHSRK